ncbi:calcium-translocating P-type ATPase, SERCA-type [Paratissierella segnis]|uniref:P-type Ca(2+) transporter n=1 Tax=Paratissierella segnis TaxID=2763679 RepID=A0A926EQN2_9FIRM|nr:calcium-translocating P-type ATPase, SERCA-type [Paratissierella segnis]MBC8586730.1 calcium-translocating P-type ATPase, SERCA-type [Paratissierella segnis]
MEWYLKSKEEVLSELNVESDVGLKENEISKRLEKYGLNELQEEKGRSFFSKLLAQFSDFLVLILIGAAIISIAVGESSDAIVILAIVVVNAFLGMYQEGKAEKALDALKKMASPNAKVIRDSQVIVVPANTLTPGDIVLLETGDIIPADLRLIESSNLKIEEASLTGESVPSEKEANESFDKEVSLGDRHNMAYMSTIVTYGRGKGVAVGTGHNTEIGKIATMIQSFEDETTPLQKKLNQLGKILGISTIVICILVFVIGLLQGREPLEMFMVAISLAVAAIPEGLPAIVTIVLAIGMNRMVKRNAIVKRLLAVETLGCTTVICSDKTGTLTQNEMTVVKVYVDDKILDVTGTGYDPTGEFKIEGEVISTDSIESLNTLLSIGMLTNDAKLDKSDDLYKIIGDPTEGSLVTLAGKANITNEINKSYIRIEEIPFDSGRKMMTTFHENFIPGKMVSFTKGAPDIIIKRCSSIKIEDKVVPFTDELKKEALEINSKFAKDALRVLAFAFREYDDLPSNISPENNETNMIFVGLVGMIDPPRPEAKDAIKECKEAGINTIMITGDYKETAFAIAKALGMAETEDQAMMGEELDNVSDEDLKEIVKKVKVFARVSPEHKVRIVSALRANGNIAAMTGDGVNDAMALKKADIGVSMGITGTDVAKNTADLILTDDNFASIVSAVEEGRIIYDNIKKFVFFLLSCNIGEILLVFVSILLNLPVPLLPIQLLWLNLVTDSFPALALGVEKGDPDIMSQNPRNPNEPILDKHMVIGIVFQSIAIAIAALSAYWWGIYRYGLDNILEARTIAFTTLITAELLRAYSTRSTHYTMFEIGVFSNKTLVYGTTFSFILMLVVIYIPFLNPIFHTFPLGFTDWEIILAFAFLPLLIGEIVKLIVHKKH